MQTVTIRLSESSKTIKVYTVKTRCARPGDKAELYKNGVTTPMRGNVISVHTIPSVTTMKWLDTCARAYSTTAHEMFNLRTATFTPADDSTLSGAYHTAAYIAKADC